VIDNKDKSEILLLGTDVTAPSGSPDDHWTKTKARSAKANGIFSAPDVDGKKVPVTHTFPDRDLAKNIAITRARNHVSSGTVVPLYLTQTTGELYPRVKALSSFDSTLRDQMWSIGPTDGEERFFVDGNRLHSGLTWQCKETEDQQRVDHQPSKEPWGYATPVIALGQEEAEASRTDRHITAYRVNKADVTASKTGGVDTPSALRATTEGSNIPRTKIIELTQEEIESRGLRKKADEAQQGRSEYWAQGGADEQGRPLQKGVMTEEQAKRKFLKDFEVDENLAEKARPLQDLG
jgi:hypothetical protein